MTALTRELERTRNGAKIMERTLEAAALRIKALEDAPRPFAKEFKAWDGVGCWDAMTIDAMYAEAPGELAIPTFADLRRAAALLEKS